MSSGRLDSHIPKDIPTKGDSYLSGNDTTAFSNLGKNAVKFGTTVTGAGALTTTVVKGFTNEDIQAIAADMASDAVAQIAGECGALIGEYSGKAASLVESIPSKITTATDRRVGSPNKNNNEEAIHDLGYWLTDKTSNKEQIIATEAEEEEIRRKTERIKEAKEKIAKTIEVANKFIEKANKKIQYIQTYALEGPQWVADQMSNTIDGVVSEVKKSLDEHFDKLELDVDNFCDQEGKQIGSKIVKETNKQLEKLATQIKNKNEEAITQTKIKSKSTLQKAKLYIMGRIGVNIPIPAGDI